MINKMKTMKKKAKKQEDFVMVCPKCKSPNVDADKSNPLSPSMGLPRMYICKRCGHTGNIFPEVALSEITKLEKSIIEKPEKDETPLVDTSYGTFEVRAIWKVAGPIALLFGMAVLFTMPYIGAVLLVAGIFMVYISYFKKKKLKSE